MRIGMDVDGVMVDFQSTWANLYEDYFGAPISKIQRDEYDALITYTHFTNATEFYDWFDRANGWPLVSEAWLPGARGAIDALTSAGHDVKFITNRPKVGAYEHTLDWYRNGPWRSNPRVTLSIRPDKWREVGIDLYVDDTPAMIEALRENGKTAVVFDQPWNRDTDGPRIVRLSELWEREFAA